MPSPLLRLAHATRILTRPTLTAASRNHLFLRQPITRPPTIHSTNLSHSIPYSTSSIPSCILSTHARHVSSSLSHPIESYQSLHHRRSTRTQHHSTAAFAAPPQSRRVVYTGRLATGIEKKRSIRARNFATSSNSSPSSIKKVSWREAIRSPRKSITYVAQTSRALVDWGKHMWAGAKLLAADVRVSSKILKRITKGKQLSRRERNFIVKTGVDLARLVPFSLFLIIPLAEFALPFALRLFPNMLPSQFQDQMQEEENMKRRLKGRLELAKYLRDVVEEKAKTIKASDANSELKKDAEDLTQFLDAIRSGKYVKASEVGRFARFFNDELTIDGAVRPQLVAMCKYMGISPYGNDIFLRFKLRSRLNAIKKDDMEIMWEGGSNSLTDEEVARACRDRGIREEASMHHMRRQLNDWLDLSQKKEIPGSLLIMSRAFLYTGPDATPDEESDGLVETLGSLTEDVIMDAKDAADVSESTTVERLEETLRQAKLIEMESAREARKEKEDEEKRKKKEAEEKAEDDAIPDQPIDDKEVMASVERQENQVIEDVMADSSQKESSATSESRETEEIDAEEEEKDEEEVQKEREGVRSMLRSLEELSSDSAVEREREELRSLKVELAGAEDFVKGTKGEGSTDMRRLKSLVTRLEREIERVDTNVGLRMKLLDKDNDGLMSLDECKNVMTIISKEPDEELVAETLERLDADADGNISKDDLARVLREMQFEETSSDDSQHKKWNGSNGN